MVKESMPLDSPGARVITFKNDPPTRFLVIRIPNRLQMKIPGGAGLAPRSILRYSPKSNMAAKRLIWSNQLFFYGK